MKIQYEKKYDVAVIGGGVAGVAAALQSARSGMKTVMVEKTACPGGLATTGLILLYLPLCDGNGHQVLFGLNEELFKASFKYGPGDIPADWKSCVDAPEQKRFRTLFSPASFMLAMDELLEEAGVDVWYDTLVCDAELEEHRITAAVCENTSGRGLIRAQCFIDATGDCTLARRAGIRCHDEYNYLTVWALEYARGASSPVFGENLRIYIESVPKDIRKAPEGTVFRGISGKAVSEFIIGSRKMLRESLLRAYAEKSDCTRKTLYPVKIPAMPLFRRIYSIDAAYTLDSGENNKTFEDSIGLLPDSGTAGPVWEIPYRSLIPADGTGGFLAAGRCTGARNDAWHITRVIPSAVMTGQVSGLAASMCVRGGFQPGELPVGKLQEALRRDCSFPIHLEDIGLKPCAGMVSKGEKE